MFTDKTLARMCPCFRRATRSDDTAGGLYLISVCGWCRMPLPSNWPVGVQPRAKQFLALLKYYKFSKVLDQAASPYLVAGKGKTRRDRDDIFRGIAFLNYWIASLHVVSEGWRELRLSDPTIDSLLTEAHVKTLRDYRHTVFHFQADLQEYRIDALATSPQVVGWVVALETAYDDFFRPHLTAVDVEQIRTWLFRASET